MQAAEAVIPAGLLRLDGSVLEQLLAADRGHLQDLARSSSSYCATGKRNGLPRGWRTSTTATSTASSGRPANTSSMVVKKDEIDSALGYFENNAPACAE
jgi:hypothetical protein